MREYWIGLDQGSQSSKALLWEVPQRRVAGVWIRPLRTQRRGEGVVEHDPQEIFQTQTAVLRAALQKAGGFGKVLGIGLCAQRSSVLAWEVRKGRPLTPVFSWQDRRAQPICGKVLQSFGNERWVEKTGLPLAPYYAAPKMRWILENVPSARRPLDRGELRFGQIPTYLVWRWTKGEVFAADPTMAQRMLIWNLERMAWDEELMEVFGIAQDTLPQVRDTVGEWGFFEWNRRKIPILCMVGDLQAAVAGLGCVRPKRTALNYGSGGFWATHTGAEAIRVPGILTSIAWTRNGQAEYLLEGTVNAVGHAFIWLKQLGILKTEKELERLCRASQGKVLCRLALGGLGAPHWDPGAKTSWEHLTPQTTRADLVRAVVEGIAHLFKDIQEAIERVYPLEGAVFRAAGGVSRLRYLMEFQAGLLGRRIEVSRVLEASALGAAVLAASSLAPGETFPLPVPPCNRFRRR
ncbi:MAG: glycerol kinase [Elusimicrobia bacterium]|nr:glycerol kinase [Elusimicrobiota bacterium]